MPDEKDVTVVITSSNRHDLLFKTLKSFFKFNTYQNVKKIIIYEDSHTYPDFLKYMKYPIPVSVIFNELRVGQILAIDIAYHRVDTPYIFHCEDDWEFYQHGFIEYSKAILDFNPKILQVWLRSPGDMAAWVGHTFVPHESKKFAFVMPAGKWLGFSFNPGLRRLSDYKLLQSYATQLLNPNYAGKFEAYIGHIYAELGYVAAISLQNDGKGFVRHIGEERHVS